MDIPDRRTGSRIDADRLLNAADVLIKAAEQRPDGCPLVDLWTGDEDLAPRNAFTAAEFVEAMLFLCRLGVAECPAPRPSSRRRPGG